MTRPPGGFPDWDELYRSQDAATMPWFYASLDPDLEAALAEYGLTRGRVLDVGTGPGTQAIELAARGFDVTGTDLSAAAIARADERARERNVRVTFAQDDVLASRLAGTFDAAFDRGCFHVLDPDRRADYVRTLAQRLVPNGLLFLKTFSHLQPGTEGPHRFTVERVRDTFASHFDLLASRETVYQGTRDPLPLALFNVLRRRP